MLEAFLLRVNRLPGFLRGPLSKLYWSWFWFAEWAKELVRQRRPVPFLWGCERARLTEEICSSYPFESVLEVGCAFGQMLTDLAASLPDVQFVGVDPDRAQIEDGSEFLKEKGLSNVRLQEGNAVNLAQFGDGSFDLVFSSAAMLFLSGSEIGRAMSEMRRIARRKIIILDLHDPSLNVPFQSMERPTYGEYTVRNWEKLLSQFFNVSQVSIASIENPLWQTEYWQTLGTIISIDVVDT